MENGGNFKVNTIFEARLAQSGKTKPTNLADGPTRERFIRDKYERRKFFDPAGFSLAGNSGEGPPRASNSGPSSASRPGAPSDVARQRVARRQARMKPSRSQQMDAPARSAKSAVAKAPVSAPVVRDLLDFGAPEPAQVAAAAAAAPTNDLFAPVSSTPSTPSAAVTSDPFAPHSSAQQQVVQPVQKPQGAPQASAPASLPGHEFLTPVPAAKHSTSNASIMALFNTPSQQAGFGAGIPNNGMMMNNGMVPQQMMMNNGMMNTNGMQQQQQQQMMMQHMMMNPMGVKKPQMTAAVGSNMQMTNNMQMMMQQKQAQTNSMNVNAMGGMVNNSGTNGGAGLNYNYNSMMQGVQQMNFGNMPQQRQQQSESSSFGTPMGGKPQTIKDDPFSSLGGMNAFR